MTPELPTIHAENQVLASLKNTFGEPCGEEILQRVINSEIFIIFGEPAIGKSTVTDQIVNELRLRNIPYEVVAYDDILDEYTKEIGEHKEDEAFNKTLVQRVLEARMRMAHVNGVVIFDTCAVGNKIPKDRSVTAVEELVKLAKEGNSFFSTIFILGLIGSLYSQYQHGRTRADILETPSHELLARLRNIHNIIIEGIPPDRSEEEVAEGIKAATSRTAQFHHIVTISFEVILEDIKVLEEIGMSELYRIHLPKNFKRRDRLLTRLKIAGMHRRARTLGLSEDQCLTAINSEVYGNVTWYASKYLRRDSN